jgi:hypothetical protein
VGGFVVNSECIALKLVRHPIGVPAVAFGALLLGSDLHIALHHFATTLYQLP